MSHAQQPHAHQGGHASPAHPPEPIPLQPSQAGGAATASHAAPARSATAHTASHGTAHGTVHGTVHGVAHLPSPHQLRGNYHPLPVIGHAEAFYVKHIEQAEAAGDKHARASYKVGQHTTAALDPKMPWDQKLKRFVHCLHRYCAAPPDADEVLAMFYQKLGDLVRRHAGQEALLLARKYHEDYHHRLKAGESRETIENEAEVFFFDLLGHGGRPEWCSKEAWLQITGWRDHWV
jgi:hypothetical protein